MDTVILHHSYDDSKDFPCFKEQGFLFEVYFLLSSCELIFSHMELNDLKKTLTDKTKEFEEAMEMGRPRELLLKLYKELKELQFAMVEAELKEPVAG